MDIGIMDIKHLRLASDLHLEHQIRNREDLTSHLEKVIPKLPTDKNSILVLAGDIVGYRWDFIPDLMIWCQDRFDSAMFLAGNHEFWTQSHEYQNFKTWDEDVSGTKDDGLGVFSICPQTEVETIILSDTQVLLGITLWTDCGKDRPLDELYIKSFPDFNYIYLNYRARASTTSIRAWHQVQVEKLKAKLVEFHNKGKEVIVATHHLPSFKLCDPRYGPQGDSLFASNLDHLLGAEWAPKYWLFGHTHIPWEMKLGNTICISNPFGYPAEKYTKYNPNFILDLDSKISL